MENAGQLNRLWIATAAGSLPLAVVTFTLEDIQKPHIYILFVLAVIFNALVVPLILFRGNPSWAIKVLAIVVNLFITTYWIIFTGGVKSIFYPSFYMVSIISAAVYCGLYEGMVTALASSLLAAMLFFQDGKAWSSFFQSNLVVHITLFFFGFCYHGLLYTDQTEAYLAE